MTISGLIRTRRKQRAESQFKASEVAGPDLKLCQTGFRIWATGLLWDGTEDESNVQCTVQAWWIKELCVTAVVESKLLWVEQGSNTSLAQEQRPLGNLALIRSLETTDCTWFFSNLSGRVESAACDWTQPNIRAKEWPHASKHSVRLHCHSVEASVEDSRQGNGQSWQAVLSEGSSGLEELQVSK